METLAALIARDGRLGAPEAVGWVVRLAKRLEVTHGRRLVHGEISAYCLLVESRSPLGHALLIDAPRTPDAVYHSPERAGGGGSSQADDTWALAITFFYALTGQFPFPGQSDAEVRQRVLASPGPQLSRYGVGDPNLQQILDAMFARELPRRVVDVPSFRVALERWSRDPSLAALPPLEDDDEDQPTVMRPQISVASLEQQRQLAAAAGGAAQAMAAPAAAPTPPPGVLPPLMSPAAGAPALEPLPPLGAAQAAPMGGAPQPGARAAPTMLAVREGAPVARNTLAVLVVVWLVVTFGGAAVEYLLLTRMRG